MWVVRIYEVGQRRIFLFGSLFFREAELWVVSYRLGVVGCEKCSSTLRLFDKSSAQDDHEK